MTKVEIEFVFEGIFCDESTLGRRSGGVWWGSEGGKIRDTSLMLYGHKG